MHETKVSCTQNSLKNIFENYVLKDTSSEPKKAIEIFSQKEHYK